MPRGAHAALARRQRSSVTTTPPGGGGGGNYIDEDPLFLPPTLVNPTTFYPTESQNTSGQYININGNGGDVIIVLPEGRPLTRGLGVGNCRNVVMIGGEITINEKMTASSTQINRHRSLGFNSCTGIIYLEGIALTNRGGGHSEGLQLWACQGARCILKNSRIDGVMTAPNDGDNGTTPFSFNHPDLIDHMSGGIRIKNCTLANSDYQGFYANSESGYPIEEIRMVNLNVRDVRRKALWLNGRGTGPSRVWVANQNVWLYQNRGPDTWPWYKSDSDVKNVSFNINSITYPFEPTSGIVVSGTYNNGTVTYTDDPDMALNQVFNLGIPPGGDFAPLSEVGTTYNPIYFRDRFYQV